MNRRVVIGAKPKAQKKTLFRLISYLGESKIALLMVILASVAATLAGLYASYAIKPLIDIIEQGLIGNLSRGDLQSSLLFQLSILVIVFLIEILMTLFSSRMMVIISQKTVETIRKDMYERMLRLEVKHHDHNAHGDLMSRFTNDIDLVGEGLNTAAASIVINIFTLIGTVIVMISINVLLSVVTMIILPFLSLLANWVVKKSRVYSKRQQNSLGVLNGYIEESMEGQMVLQLFNHEKQAQEKFEGLNKIYRKNSQWAQITSIMIYPLMQNLNTISYAIIGVVGGYLSIFKGLSIGSLSAYVNMTRTQGKPINEISQQFTTLQSALASAERIFELLDWEEELVNEDDIVLEHVEGSVRFENVDFSYVEGTPILRDVSFWAKPGQKIAFVGSTGGIFASNH